MADPQVLQLGQCQVRIFDEVKYLETLFSDGTRVPAAPEDNQAYRENAERLGYGADTWAMCREHEIAHTQLMQLLGLPHSPSLWSVAHGTNRNIVGCPGEMAAEENLVMAYQRWRNTRDDC